MNLLIELDAASLVLRFTFEGPLTDATLIAGLAEAPKVVKVYPGCRGILDFSRVSEYDLSPDVLRQLAKSAPVIPAGYDRVFVAPQDYLYGMARMFSILAEQTRPELHVVRTMREAFSILGIQSPQFVPLPPFAR